MSQFLEKKYVLRKLLTSMYIFDFAVDRPRKSLTKSCALVACFGLGASIVTVVFEPVLPLVASLQRKISLIILMAEPSLPISLPVFSAGIVNLILASEGTAGPSGSKRASPDIFLPTVSLIF